VVELLGGMAQYYGANSISLTDQLETAMNTNILGKASTLALVIGAIAAGLMNVAPSQATGIDIGVKSGGISIWDHQPTESGDMLGRSGQYVVVSTGTPKK
jgi:hypothetical protein